MRWHIPKRGRRAIVGAVVVGVAASGIVAYAASGASANYRTATVALGNVTQVLNLTGTVSPSGRSDLQFGTAGTVTRVLPVGTAVRRGDVVASLDTTQLNRALVIAQAAVTQALAQLDADQTTLDTPTSSATDTSTPARSGGGGAAADAALAAAQRACVGTSGGSHAGGGRPTSSPTPTASPSASATSTPSATGSSTPTPTSAPTSTPIAPSGSTSSNTAACAAALQQLGQVVHQLSASSAKSSSGSTTSGSTARSSGLGVSSHVTQATISRDEASVAQARTKVIQAQQQLTGAVITAPADGTVAQTDVTVGAAASAGTTAITVIGAGVTTVTINATLAQVGKLAIDQSASVSTTVGAKVATGKVTWIGQLPNSSTTSTFPVVVTLDGDGKSLEAGSPVDVAVSLGTANGVIAVPTSAVRDGFVTVLDGTRTTTTRVTVGLVGSDLTQITSGLTPGQTVVLANLDSALPTSTVNQPRFGIGGFGGGLGGGGLGGGTRRALGG